MHGKRVVLYLAAILVTLEFIYLGYQYSGNSKATLKIWGDLPEVVANKHDISTTVKQFLADIRELHPSRNYGNVPSLDHSKKNMGEDMSNYDDPDANPLTIEKLEDYLIVEDEWRDTLRHQHEQVVAKIPPVRRELLKGRGVVVTGGGKYFASALVGIRFVLDYHPGLPVEIWMARDEYEPMYCDEIFPALNVSCMVMEDFFGEELDGFDYMGFPLKSLALLGSSFEEIYFMDVDSFSMFSMNDLFNSKPYNDTGFISWPDYWPRVTTPDFYDVAGVFDIKKVNRGERLTDQRGVVHDHKSSESGQMIINKFRHWDTTFLAAYYNLNGRQYYYPLLSQSGNVLGFGDKETFISAAAVLGHPAYQVVKGPGVFGYHKKNGEYKGDVIVQHDPFSDYKKYHEKVPGAIDRPYILHANNMKLRPDVLFYEGQEELDNTPNLWLLQRRLMGDRKSTEEFFGFDSELVLLQTVQNVLCDWMVQYKPQTSDPAINITEMCTRAKNHVLWLQTHDSNPW